MYVQANAHHSHSCTGIRTHTHTHLKCVYCISIVCVCGAVVLNRLSLEKYKVLWMSSDTIFKQKKDILSQLWSMVGEKLGKGQAYGAARSAILLLFLSMCEWVSRTSTSVKIMSI